MKQNFRQLARESLRRAQAELATGDDDRLKCAALELRMTMEALTYERAQDYAPYIPKEDYETWQPHKVLKMLFDLEPAAAQSMTVSIGKNPYVEGEDVEWLELGTETVLTTKELSKNYQALGNFLHIPTYSQFEQNKAPTASTVRDRCKLIAIRLEACLASTLSGFRPQRPVTGRCPKCDSTVRCHFKLSGEPSAGSCSSCGLRFTAISDGDGGVNLEFRTVSAPCPSCKEVGVLREVDAQPGFRYSCAVCDTSLRIAMGIVPLAPHHS